MMPGMGYAIGIEIDKFERLLQEAGRVFDLVQEVPFSGVLTPRGSKSHGSLSPSKDIALTLLGLTHGNEWAGVSVLNGVLEHLLAGTLELRVPIAVALGNPRAALENSRFLERDLNRSFARTSQATHEERRALELEGLLRRTGYLVDFHQTMQPSDRAFFIFPYRPEALQMAQAIAPHQTIVTHWGEAFSAEGKCSDEYVNDSGGLGISIELGQNGLDSYQIAVGVECALWAIHVATARTAGRTLEELVSRRQGPVPEIYTWEQIVPWPLQGLVTLDPGWTNFREVRKNDRLGMVGGDPLLSCAAGRILFPKYLTPEQQALAATRPTELVRIMRRVSLAELPV